MATIVEQLKTGDQFVLLGTGFGAFQSKKPNWFLGDLMADTTEGQFAMICVSDATGKIGWMRSSEARVVSIDSVPIASALRSP